MESLLFFWKIICEKAAGGQKPHRNWTGQETKWETQRMGAFFLQNLLKSRNRIQLRSAQKRFYITESCDKITDIGFLGRQPPFSYGKMRRMLDTKGRF